MIYENLFAQECKPDDYQPPRTTRATVVAEGNFCNVTSGEPASVKSENNYIEVEKYSTIENDVTFE